MQAAAVIEPNQTILPPGRKHHYPADRKRTPRKMNQRVAIDQAKRGMNNADIARAQGLSKSTVGDFMARMNVERGELESFKSQRADVLAQMQAMSLDVQRDLLKALKDRDLSALTPQQMSSLMFALNAQHGTTYDKERLERGQSTSNQSIVSRLIDHTVKDLYAQPAACQEHDGTKP